MESRPQNITDVHIAAYRAYVQAMKEGMADLDVDALAIDTSPPNEMAIPACVGTQMCNGCVGCVNSIGSYFCVACWARTQ